MKTVPVYLEELGLVSGKGTTNPQIQLLSRINGQGFILVGCHEVVHSFLYICVCYSTEVGSVDSLGNKT